jgi:hydrogenase-4 component F
MSGVLLTVAFYALLRFKAIADGATGPGYPRALLVVAGLASLAVAASLLISQRDYKRMLAYHSVEHMGLIALGAAAGSSLAIAAVLLHILGHGLARACSSSPPARSSAPRAPARSRESPPCCPAGRRSAGSSASA